MASAKLFPFWKLKPPIPCPSGEQIINGGFETGDFTGWTATGNIEVNPYNSHSGTYNARNPRRTTDGKITQTLANVMPSACLVATSTFSIWMRSDYTVSPPQGGLYTVKINYSDGTSTTVQREITSGEANTWIELDLKPYVTAGKTITGIEITLSARSTNLVQLDDVSLKA